MRKTHRPTLFLALAVVPLVLVLLIFLGRDDGAMLGHGAIEQITPDTEVAALITPAATEPSTPTNSDPSNEVAALVKTADTATGAAFTSPPPPGARAQSQTQSATSTARPPLEPTTTTAATGQVGICVFDNGTIASSVQESVCSGFFTQDPAEANTAATEIRGESVTTTTTTTTTTTSPTTTTTTTTTEKVEPPTTDPTTTTTTNKGRGRWKDNDQEDPDDHEDD